VDVKTAIEEVNNVVTSAAVVVGGIWAYFKFIRGRTFAHRAELEVTPSLDQSTGTSYLSVAVTLKNTGLSKLPLNANMKAVRLSGIAGDASDGLRRATWQRILTSPTLETHAWLEAQETVTDTVVYSLHVLDVEGPRAVYQIEAIVGSRRRLITRKGTQWTARAVVFVPIDRNPKKVVVPSSEGMAK
jgi:hypothetical protein